MLTKYDVKENKTDDALKLSRCDNDTLCYIKDMVDQVWGRNSTTHAIQNNIM